MIKKTAATLGAVALTFGLWAASADAQQPDGRKAGDVPGPIDNLEDLQDTGRMIFKLADQNNDGQISQKEAIDAGNLVAGGFFFRADQNGDGTLSKDEARQARDAFLASKPWLRYAVETAKASKAAAGDTNKPQNPIAALAATFDTNGDKQLQAGELRSAVQTVVQGEFATADTNRDGQLSPAEVNAALTGASRQLAEAAFKQADTDNNGQISQAEFEKAIINPARIVFNIIDLNHDGQISPQEAQTARQVVVSRVRALNIPEPSNSPRNRINQALGSQAQPTTPAPPAAPAPAATPAPPPNR